MLKFILPIALLALSACVTVNNERYDPVTNPDGQLRPGDCYEDLDGLTICT